MAKTVTKAVAKKASAELTEAQKKDSLSWGDDDVEAGDILIPKLFVLNPMSALCIDKPDEYRSGDIVRSTDKKVIANTKDGIAFIPIADTKVWKVSKSTGTKYEFVRFEDYTKDTADLPWNWEEDGVKWRRDTTVNMFCLLPSDILREKEAFEAFEKTGDLPDPDDVVLPCCISFSRTSYSSAKILITHKAKCSQMGMNMAVKTFSLKSRMETKEDNKYYVLDVESLERTEPSFLPDCKKWYQTIKATNVKLDEEAEDAAVAADKAHTTDSDVSEVSDQF